MVTAPKVKPVAVPTVGRPGCADAEISTWRERLSFLALMSADALEDKIRAEETRTRYL
jgi:hypothetical protein